MKIDPLVEMASGKMLAYAVIPFYATSLDSLCARVYYALRRFLYELHTILLHIFFVVLFIIVNFIINLYFTSVSCSETAVFFFIYF